MKRPIRRVLVIAAHPDDEVLGCGGTLALHTRIGDEVHAAIACEGESLRYGPEGVGQSHHMQQAAQTLGLQDVRLLGFPDQRLDTVTLTDIIAPLEQRVREVRPDIVYCQYGGDVNRDHELLFKAALVATRPTENCIGAIYRPRHVGGHLRHPRDQARGHGVLRERASRLSPPPLARRAAAPRHRLGEPELYGGCGSVHDRAAHPPPWSNARLT